MTNEWWRSAVIYQIYPRSFADVSGDGVGDLAGITQRLDSLASLGVDVVWLSPFMTSPQKDAGYDVANYRDVDPLFGTLDDFDAMLARAHDLDLKVIADLVPNHSSDQHPWFQQALAAPAGSPERARYMFREGRGASGELPPNNWESVFGGPAWTRVEDGQWYLHLFDSSQPDFDWSNEEVREEFRQILRFWLDRGVDGFRVDVAHGLVKAEGLPDYTPPEDADSMGGAEPVPYWGQEGVHEIYRDWHRVLAEYSGDRVLCAEAWMPTVAEIAKWVRPDEMHQSFNFPYLSSDWDAAQLRTVIDEYVERIDTNDWHQHVLSLYLVGGLFDDFFASLAEGLRDNYRTEAIAILTDDTGRAELKELLEDALVADEPLASSLSSARPVSSVRLAIASVR